MKFKCEAAIGKFWWEEPGSGLPILWDPLWDPLWSSLNLFDPLWSFSQKMIFFFALLVTLLASLKLSNERLFRNPCIHIFLSWKFNSSNFLAILVAISAGQSFGDSIGRRSGQKRETKDSLAWPGNMCFKHLLQSHVAISSNRGRHDNFACSSPSLFSLHFLRRHRRHDHVLFGLWPKSSGFCSFILSVLKHQGKWRVKGDLLPRSVLNLLKSYT